MTAHDDAMPEDMTDAEAFDFDPPLSWDPGDSAWAPTPGDNGRGRTSEPHEVQ